MGESFIHSIFRFILYFLTSRGIYGDFFHCGRQRIWVCLLCGHRVSWTACNYWVKHPEVAVVTGADHIEGVALNLLAPLRPQPRRPPRPGDRQDFQNRQGEVRRVGAGVDQKIRNVNLAPSPPSHTRNNICTRQQSVCSISKIENAHHDPVKIKRRHYTNSTSSAPTYFSESSNFLLTQKDRLN